MQLAYPTIINNSQNLSTLLRIPPDHLQELMIHEGLMAACDCHMHDDSESQSDV